MFKMHSLLFKVSKNLIPLKHRSKSSVPRSKTGLGVDEVPKFIFCFSSFGVTGV
jgi:hypothetical protein